MEQTVIGLDGMPLNTHAVVAGGYTALGYSGNLLYIYSALQQRIVQLRPSLMDEMTLKAICGANWCEEHYAEIHPKKGELVFNHKRLATDIITACQDAGLYCESMERRNGVWPADNGSALIINGSALWRDDGTILANGLVDGKAYPKCGGVGFGPETPTASEEDVNRLLNAFGAYHWSSEMVPEMLLGWFVCAVLAPALQRRPHIYISGRAGTGKSVLLCLMASLLGPLAHKASGPQSKAGLYQSLAGTPRAVLLDEAEADSSGRKWVDMLEIARIAYSLAENDRGIGVGTSTGEARFYHFVSPFLAAGINPGKFEPADLSRWAIFDVSGRKADADNRFIGDEEARELGARLAVTAVRRWSVLQASLEVIRKAIMRQGGDARLADTVGPLLAGYWTLVSDSPAAPDDAETLVGLCGLNQHLEQREESDEARCLDSLFSRVVTLPVTVEGCWVRQPLSIGQAIAKICENPVECLDMQNRLTQLGLRVTRREGRWIMMVANSPEHTELRKMFYGTKWQHGGWSTSLRRLPGGDYETQRLGTGYKPCKVTVFDVPVEILPANDEDEEMLAA